MTIWKVFRVLGLLVLVASPASGQSDDYAQFARLIADHLPASNGLPTEVSPLARCATFSPGFECEGSDRELPEAAAAYAEVDDIPIRRREGFSDRRPCRWSSEGDSPEAGLSLNLGRPEIEGDEAMVYAVISCNSERNFRMVQLFWLERGPDARWRFVKTQTTAIT